MDWLWQNLLSNGVYALVVLVGAGAVTVFKKKNWSWTEPILYGIVAGACVAVGIFAFTGRAIFAKQPANAGNVEEKIKSWTANLGLGIEPIASGDRTFEYKILLPSGNPVLVGWSQKERPEYVQFLGNLTLSPEHQAALAKLTPDDIQAVKEELILELTKSGIGFTIFGPDPAHSLDNVALQKAIPLSSISAESFPVTLNEIDTGETLTKAALAIALRRHTVMAITPHPVRQ